MGVCFRGPLGLLSANTCSGTLLPLTLIAAVMAMAIVGCGHSDRAAVYPAEGRVVWNGQPLAGAQVVLYPQGQSDAKTVPARAQTDSEGRFRLSTYGTADGAPEGEYAVTVVHYRVRQQDGGSVPGPNVLPAKYASPKTTDLRVQIAKGTNTLPTLALPR